MTRKKLLNKSDVTKYLIKQLSGTSPIELDAEMYQEMQTEEGYAGVAFNLQALFDLDSPEEEIPSKKIYLSKKLGQGGFNTAWLSKINDNPEYHFVYRVSIEKPTKKERDLASIETGFNLFANHMHPGELTEFTYYANDFAPHPFQMKELFDGNLYDFMDRFRNVSMQVEAVNKAFACIDMLENLGIHCMDQSGGNFLYMKGRRPINYNGPVSKDSLFVRITDLGADFCTREFDFGSYTQDLFRYRHRLQLLFTLESDLKKEAMKQILIDNDMCHPGDVEQFSKWISKASTQRENRTKPNWDFAWAQFNHYSELVSEFVVRKGDKTGKKAPRKLKEFMEEYCPRTIEIPQSCYLTMADIERIRNGGASIKVMINKKSVLKNVNTLRSINLTISELKKHVFTDQNGYVSTASNKIWIKQDCYERWLKTKKGYSSRRRKPSSGASETKESSPRRRQSPRRSSPRRRQSPRRSSSQRRQSPRRSSSRRRQTPRRQSPRRQSPRRSSSRRQSPRRRSSGKQCKGAAPRGKICNPKTGRWVKKDGVVGRKIRAAQGKRSSPRRQSPRRQSPRRSSSRRRSSGKQCKGAAPRGKICNPKTGRWVKKDGVVGRKILAAQGKRSSPRRSSSRRQSPRRQSPRRSSSRRRSSGKKCKGAAPRGKICNPKTGRWVKKDGVVGRKILQKKKKRN